MDNLRFGTLFKFYDNNEVYRFIKYYGLDRDFLYEDSQQHLCVDKWTRIEQTVPGVWHHKAYVLTKSQTIGTKVIRNITLYHSKFEAEQDAEKLENSGYEVTLEEYKIY